jgi:hypothetical protein
MRREMRKEEGTGGLSLSPCDRKFFGHLLRVRWAFAVCPASGKMGSVRLVRPHFPSCPRAASVQGLLYDGHACDGIILPSLVFWFRRGNRPASGRAAGSPTRPQMPTTRRWTRPQTSTRSVTFLPSNKKNAWSHHFFSDQAARAG